jgi:uncharacterized membrane protein
MTHREEASNEDQIIARARQEVAARRTAGAHQLWRWLLPTLVLAVLVTFFVTPVPLPRKVLLAMGGVCGLRPTHSYFAGGVQLPLESRMTGIYGGFLLTSALLLACGRVGARQLGRRLIIGILVVFFASMALDGINSSLAEFGVLHLYEPTNTLRLVTGLLSGIAIAPLMVWLVDAVALPREKGAQQPAVRSPWELAAPLLLNAGFGLLVGAEQAVFYFPIALISVAGVVGVLALVALLVILTLSGLAQHVTHLGQMVTPGALAILIAFAVLAATAAARWTVTASI